MYVLKGTGVLHLDIETFSSVSLRDYGVYRYAASPDFMILMAAWSDDGEHVRVALGEAEVLAIPGLLDPAVTKVAHNAQFERVCFSNALRRSGVLGPDEWLPPAQWHDTMAVAAELGWPQSLGKLAKALGAQQKDEAGTRLVSLFCKPNRDGERNLPRDYPMQWLDFIAYCETDVESLIDVDARLGGWPTPAERDVYLADQAINDRGIRIDRALARNAYAVGQLNAQQQKARVRELTGLENPGSVQQMARWAAQVGLPMVNWRAETVELALRAELPADQREVLELRQELALAAPAKFATAINSQVGGRLHGTLKFFGAHTGRWAGRGTQVQNLPRASFRHEVDQVLAIGDLMAGEQLSSEELKKLVRPMFLGPFTVVDYAAVEAVVIAWLAGEEWVLEAFRDGRDVYLETAERMGGLTRAQGKIAVLALGFNGGAGSLRAMAGDGDFLPPKPDGSRRRPAEGSPDNEASLRIRDATDEELFDELVYPWRAANPSIVRLWKVLDARFRTGGPVGEHLVFEKAGKDRLLRLPSGRAICYRGCGIKRNAEGRERLTFASPQGYLADTYGGRLAENATQAVARDLLGEALVRLEARGYPVVAHVHDEILVEGKHDVAEIGAIMCEPPSWAGGLPIRGSGFVCERYKK